MLQAKKEGPPFLSNRLRGEKNAKGKVQIEAKI